MGEANFSEIDHVAIGEDGDFTNCRNNVKSNGLCDVLKFCLLKFAINGADRVFRDKNSRKSNYFANGLNEEAMLHDNLQAHQQRGKYKFGTNNVPESSRDRFNVTNEWNNEYMNMSKVVNSSSGGIIEFPLNLLAFFALSLMKFAGFQFNLFLNFISFPIWFSYSSLMFFLFPFHTLSQVRGYIMRKLLGVTGNIITLKAIRFGWAFVWSIYVCVILIGMLGSGFLFGGILMRYLLLEKPIQATETLNFDYTKTSPVAFVPVMSYPGMDNPSSLIVKENVEAGKDAGPRAIPFNHKLHLTVSLTVPESEYNRNLGVFQVRVEFLSGNGKVTGSTSYPFMLKFKSQPIQFVETIIKSAPLIAGFQSESQILNIKMSEFTEGLEPTASLKVILEPRAEYKAGAGIPEIYAASLTLESELTQLKRIIWNWRRTIFVWISFMCFATELLIVLVVFRSMIIPRGMPKIVYAKKGSALNYIPWYKSS